MLRDGKQMAYTSDGKTIAFTAFKEGDTDLWLMENFLPATE